MERADFFFEHVSNWQVIVCKQCRCAVWPSEVAAHLTNKQHSRTQKLANSIREEVEQWQGVIQYPSGFDVPSFVTEPVQELPLFDDGWQCRLDECAYITRETKALKKHWRIEHEWSVQQGRGGSGPAKQEAAQRRFEEASKRVKCQRFFRSRAHSQYFEVRGAEDDPDTTKNGRDGAETWEMAWEAASASYEQKKKCDIIRPGESDEVNPWLRRTGWVPYLTGCPQNDLLATVRKPDEQADGQNEVIAAVIWDAVGDVAAIAESGVRRSGVMLRFEAIRTEINQVRYAPLEPYRDSDRVYKECRPWQQMVTFFVRTQQDNTRQTPPYRFNNRQRIAFHRLVAAAQQEVARRDGDSDDDSGSGSDQDDNSEDDMGTDSQAKTDVKGKADTIPGGKKTVQLAALDFCIELLNQTMQQHETEMALVCALAVLGVSPTRKGFRDEEVFPSILSSIIKIAHFMVVWKAEQVTGNICEEEWAAMESPCTFDDSGYESDRSQRRKRRRATRSSFQWVKKMMDAFMVRGTASPMQWMLDLRAYGMKVSFNTTSQGHVGWRNGDVLQYKDIHFSMAQFRGMVDQLQRTTRKQLMEIMFASDEQDVPAVPWKDLFDDPSNDSDGWSFVDDTRTPWPVDGRRWLFERVRKRPECRQRFVSDQTANGVNEAKLRDWMKTIDDFRGQLLALMHITGGQPARGPEILSVRHSNTAQGRFRNLFIEDGMVVFVTQYHKGEQYQANVKIIHRYLPREVGELVVWYRWLVVPFVQRMRSWLWSDPVVSDHI